MILHVHVLSLHVFLSWDYFVCHVLGCGATQWGPCCCTEVVYVEHLRSQAQGGVVVSIRPRLGRGTLLYLLRSSTEREHHHSI